MNYLRKMFLPICLVGIVAVACGTASPPETATTPEAAPAAEAGASTESQPEATPEAAPMAEGQISAEPVYLNIFASAATGMPAYDEMEHMIAHSERTNVFVTWEHVPLEHHEERFNVILATNELPDMFWNIRNAGYLALRSGGMARDISEFLTPELMPNLHARMAEFPFAAAEFTDPDGAVFFLPFMDGNTTNDPLIVRADWLDALDLPLPVTLDDWYQYWVGVRDNDLNGTGDAIPLSVVNATNRVNYFRTWVSAFEMNDRFFVDQQNGGNIIFSNIDPRYRDFLEWANMLWEEDILDREFASIDTDGHRMRNAQNRLGSYRGKLNGQLNSYMLNLPNEIPGFSLLATEPIRSAGGLQLHPGVEGIVRLDVIGGIVTSTSQFPKEAVLFTDWFYDWTAPTGGGFQNAFGLEGNTFVFNDDRTEFFYSDYVLNNPDGLTPSEVLIRYTTRGQHAGFVDAIGTLRMWHDNTVESFRTISPFYASSLPWKMPNLAALTDDDHRQIRSIMADVDTYVDEMVNNFIMGRRPISEFDSFVAEVENMGIHEVLEIYNRAFALHGGR